MAPVKIPSAYHDVVNMMPQMVKVQHEKEIFRSS
jgi:hypothetical protein